MSSRPRRLDDVEALIDAVIDKVGREIVLGLPLGLGKANHVANALYRRAEADRSIRLSIFTALTLEPPVPGNALERRFLEPLNRRLFAGYPRLAYAEAMHAGRLPPNVEINEFFLLAGHWLGVAPAQQHYISANYSHASGYLLQRGVNVVAQLVALDGDRVSLSCNPDITLDILPHLDPARLALIGQVNGELPFMGGDAALPAETFDWLLQGPAYEFPLFAPPKPPVSDADYAIGLHAASLVPDGGTLQIGIGSLGDAVTAALILRQRENALFTETLARLGPSPLAERVPFEEGLYGASEMFVDGFLRLHDAGILKRGAEDGALLHAGFFLADRCFYRELGTMPTAVRDRFRMTAISYVNTLGGDAARKRRERVGARFINNAMMATLLGAVVSDGFDSGQVLSGVGGQFDFVDQAFQLPGARSIIGLGATRETGRGADSNLRWNYGHVTVPRHMRDLVVTEYGVADLRGRSDAECVTAMLAIADARFQDELLAAARRAGKIGRDYRIPQAARGNRPGRIAEALAPARSRGYLPPFPFGTDFTPEEQRLLPALKRLKAISGDRWALARAAWAGFRAPMPPADELKALARMGLKRPAGLGARFWRSLLRWALMETRTGRS